MQVDTQKPCKKCGLHYDSDGEPIGPLELCDDCSLLWDLAQLVIDREVTHQYTIETAAPWIASIVARGGDASLWVRTFSKPTYPTRALIALERLVTWPWRAMQA